MLVSASAIGRPMNMTGTMVGDNSNQNYFMMFAYGPNITDSVRIGPTLAKTVERASAYQFS